MLTHFAGNISAISIHEIGVIPDEAIKIVVRNSKSTIQEVIGSIFSQ